MFKKQTKEKQTENPGDKTSKWNENLKRKGKKIKNKNKWNYIEQPNERQLTEEIQVLIHGFVCGFVAKYKLLSLVNVFCRFCLIQKRERDALSSTVFISLRISFFFFFFLLCFLRSIFNLIFLPVTKTLLLTLWLINSHQLLDLYSNRNGWKKKRTTETLQFCRHRFLANCHQNTSKQKLHESNDHCPKLTDTRILICTWWIFQKQFYLYYDAQVERHTKNIYLQCSWLSF